MNNLKQFISDFDFTDPDFGDVPEGFPNSELGSLKSEDVGKFNAIKAIWELSRPKKPEARSRVWQDPRGYRFLVQWSNAVLLRILAVKWIDFVKTSKESKGIQYINCLEAQFLDCLRSVIANIEEGFVRPTTSEYLQFLGYSQASLAEGNGDIERAFQDGLLKSVQGSSLKDLGIDLKLWNDWAKNPVNNSKLQEFPLKGNKGRYRILKEIKGKDLTYEIFKELFNKTDWNLRRLVESLEKKQNQERKGYQTEQARIKGNIRGF